MERKPILSDELTLPEELRTFINNSPLYDSSCSNRAKVIYVEKDCGYFIKIANEGALRREAFLGRWMSSYGLSARINDYFSENGNDYLVTERLRGEDATHKKHLAEPKKLCEILADALRNLHSKDPMFCPIQALLPERENKAELRFDPKYISCMGFTEKELADAFNKKSAILKTDSIIHGDACLPNYILDDFKFSGFVDVGEGGIGDRHIDLFWCVWSLAFNLGTNEYKDYFLSAYGKELIDRERLCAAVAVSSVG